MESGGVKRVTWRILHQTVVCVHSEEAPTDQDWNEHLRAVRAHTDLLRILVFTYGGAPNAAQRAALNNVLSKVRVPVAILTPSTLARGVGTALHWFNPRMRVFDPENVEGALDHLGAPRDVRSDLHTALTELKREVDFNQR